MGFVKFAVFAGVGALTAKGVRPNLPGLPGAFLTAFFTDTLIDHATRGDKPPISAVISSVDWAGFVSFVVGKTIPLIWISAHTLTFMLPPEYRVLATLTYLLSWGSSWFSPGKELLAHHPSPTKPGFLIPIILILYLCRQNPGDLRFSFASTAW